MPEKRLISTMQCPWGERGLGIYFEKRIISSAEE